MHLAGSLQPAARSCARSSPAAHRSSPRLQLPEEARLALRSYRASLARNTAVRTFLELSGDFCPPGGLTHSIGTCGR